MKKSIIGIGIALALLGGCASNPAVSEAEIFKQYPSVLEAKSLLSDGINIIFAGANERIKGQPFLRSMQKV
ncbi:MAG: hypothetical protein ACI9IT_001513 [Glaciecola sp.]|jgi:hypothetical protein